MPVPYLPDMLLTDGGVGFAGSELFRDFPERFLVETRSLAGDVPLYLAGKGRALHQPL